MEFNVSAIIRIMPEGVDVNLDDIKEKTEKEANRIGKFHSAKIVPIAFGLKSLEVAVLMNDDAGGMDDLIGAVSKIEGVQSVEMTEVNRL